MMRRRMMMGQREEEDEVKEWKCLVDITTEVEQTQRLNAEFDKGYKELRILFEYPQNDKNVNDCSFVVNVNEGCMYGASAWLMYKYAQKIYTKIEAEPFDLCVMEKYDIHPSWYGVVNNRTSKMMNYTDKEFYKVTVGSEYNNFVFGAGTKLKVFGR